MVDNSTYLERRGEGLGRRLLREVLRVESRMLELPEAGREIRPGIRKCPLRTFSYAMIYAMERDCIFTLGFAHHRRRPEYWLGRAGGGSSEGT